MKDIIKIPEKRKPVLIGKNGRVKKKIERETETNIKTSKNIIIKGSPLNILTAKKMVKAIGRGFSPTKAEKLLTPKNTLVIIEIAKKRNKLKRIKGRLIGREGKCRKRLESISNCNVSIYGKTISIIGKHEHVRVLRKGIEKIINGSPHSYVYKYLKKNFGDYIGSKNCRRIK